jgi:Sigma-70 region 2
MRDDPAVTGLVTRAANGQEQAWDALVERYAPLIWSICRKHRLGNADADDVGQRVWLQLVDHLDKVPGSGRATRVARHHDPARMRTSPARGARSTRCRSYAGRRDHPGPSSPDGRATTARRGAPRSAARGIRSPSPMLPAANHPAHPGPAPAIRHDRRQAEHPSRQHRTEPRPLPGQAPPRPGHRSTDQRRSRNPGSELPGKRLHSHDQQPMAS